MRHLAPVSLYSCFLIAGIPMANALGARDAEPSGATLTLWLLCAGGSAIGAICFATSSTQFGRSGGPMIGAVTGFASAGAFFALLALVHRGIGLWISVGLAVLAVVVLASAAALVAPAKPKG